MILKTALDARNPQRTPEALRAFVEAGVLGAADVHVAVALCRLHHVDDDLVLLGAAFATRAPRAGHSCLDVDLVATSVVDELVASPDVDPVAALPWPDPDRWLAALQGSSIVGPGGGAAPLVVEGRRVFLSRMWQQEVDVAADLGRRAAVSLSTVDGPRLDAMLDALFPDGDDADPQRAAVRAAVEGRLTVLAGGPGTGKTWTVARALAALVDQFLARGEVPGIALVAPTGKAAARLDEGVREAVASMDVRDEVRDVLRELPRGQTIHRLLGRRSATRFWHDRDRPLAHDIVVVDETSMASLSLTAHLLDAIRADAHVILVGDPGQLASVEAGSVLGDVVGDPPAAGVVVLRRPRRFAEGSGIGALATAIHGADADAALAALVDRDDLHWLPTADPTEDDLAEVRQRVVGRAQSLVTAGRRGDADEALARLGDLVVLCAHRRGRDGVAGWNARVDRWLALDVEGWKPYEVWQAGRVVLATSNDRRLEVFNGDLGAVIEQAAENGPVLRAVFPGAPRPVAPSRLEGAEAIHAMTIHKSQGSQWEHVVVVLPAQPSRILTRELLYTAVTRASGSVTVIGAAETIAEAIARPVRRASGLADRLRSS